MFDLNTSPHDLPDAMARATWLGRRDGSHHRPAMGIGIVAELAPGAPANIHQALLVAYESGYWSALNMKNIKP